MANLLNLWIHLYIRLDDVTIQTLRILKSNGIYNIRHLTRRTEVDLLKTPTPHNSVIKEMKEALEELGLSLSSIQEYQGVRPGIHRFKNNPIVTT